MKAPHPFCCALILLLGLALLPSVACFAAGYPDRPIQVILPHPAGSVADITLRMAGDEMDKILGQRTIVLNKPGAGTVLGADAVVRSKKDGYTIFYGGASPTIYAPITNPEVVHYDPAKDLEPLGFHFFLPTVIGVRTDAPWKTLAEFLDYAKKNPGKIRMTSIGVGSSTHFAIEVFQSMTGTRYTHVPYEGGETVVTAVLGGHAEAAMDGFQKLKPHVDAGRMRILLIDPKMPAYPNIPSPKELGYKQSLPASWFGFWNPAGIPEEAKRVLVPAIEKAIKTTKPKIDQMGDICEYKSPADMKKLRDDEYRQIYDIAVKIGLRKQ
ncbi:MAG TPA: tripartite tricarboxylate transporter substrate binding protein [Syntrophorhabdales bacterium]|nr:tripartite tricarboxylate transporter substrate binding protein [Syntrophorhabdales bacterium]